MVNRIAAWRCGPWQRDHRQYEATMKKLWNEIKTAVDISLSTEFGDIEDLALLATVKQYVSILVQQEKRQYGGTNRT